MGDVELLSTKVIDLVKLYTRGHYAAKDVVDMLEQVLIEDGYITPEEPSLNGSEEGQDI
jgi:hypothetical protein